MFGKEFYPTPDSLARAMLSMVDLKQVESVLEPGGGRGDLCHAVARPLHHAQNRYSKDEGFDDLDIDVCEIDPDLRSVLKGKGLRVIHDDFLTLNTCKQYDLILMNPPFSQGTRHLLKALDMQKDGGQVVCLLNAETLNNPCNNERRELAQRLEELSAKVEYHRDVFLHADRPADVEVAIVYVHIATKQKPSILFEQLRRAQQEAEPPPLTGCGTLIENDFYRGIVKQYDLEVRAGVALIREFEAMTPLTLTGFDSHKSALQLKIGEYSASVNRYIREMRKKYWTELLRKPQFVGLLTNNLQQEYESRIAQLADYDFSLYNIYTMRIEIADKLVEATEQTILDLFEDFSNKHSYSDYSNNIHYYNGWKTNKAWKVNHRIVYRLNGFDSIWGYYPENYSIVRTLQDIEKTFNYLDGGMTADIDIESRMKRAKAHGVTKKIQLKYFNITFYKKGTAHIEFTNEQLLKKFNIFGSQRKGWLPPGYGKTHYKDMSAEEQAVARAFDGSAEEYEKTVQHAAYYLQHTNAALELEMGRPGQNQSA